MIANIGNILQPERGCRKKPSIRLVRLVLVGKREPDGGHDLAPKHMSTPIGWDNYYGFVCTPRHHTYGNIQRGIAAEEVADGDRADACTRAKDWIARAFDDEFGHVRFRHGAVGSRDTLPQLDP